MVGILFLLLKDKKIVYLRTILSNIRPAAMLIPALYQWWKVLQEPQDPIPCYCVIRLSTTSDHHTVTIQVCDHTEPPGEYHSKDRELLVLTC